MNEMDMMLGITGPLDAQGERDTNLYCRFVRNMRRERALPHLRLRYSPARGRTVEHWKVEGPKGHTLWGSGRTAAGAIRAYQQGHVYGRPG